MTAMTKMKPAPAVNGLPAPDQRRMRHIVPEKRLRSYEVRDVIRTLADEGSILELRRDFGRTLVTALIRLEGRPLEDVQNVRKLKLVLKEGVAASDRQA